MQENNHLTRKYFLVRKAVAVITFADMSRDELTTSQLAAELNVTPVTARLWCRRGLFPNAYLIDTARGAIWMIPRGDLKGFEPPKKTGRPRKPDAEKPARKRAKK
jgi:hypothetical protein